MKKLKEIIYFQLIFVLILVIVLIYGKYGYYKNRSKNYEQAIIINEKTLEKDKQELEKVKRQFYAE